MNMKLIIGLGNPGVQYKNNRHNIGHMVIDELQPSTRIKGLIIKKSDAFMNNSGFFVKKQMSKYPSIQPADLYIIHDDLDIPLGAFKIQLGKGPKVHNGLNDIYEKINTDQFWHVRVGVDNRDPKNRTKGDEYVLQDFAEDEKLILGRVIKQICNQLVS